MTKRCKSGMTLVEVMVFTFIISLSIIGVTGVIQHAMKYEQIGHERLAVCSSALGLYESDKTFLWCPRMPDWNRKFSNTWTSSRKIRWSYDLSVPFKMDRDGNPIEFEAKTVTTVILRTVEDAGKNPTQYFEIRYDIKWMSPSCNREMESKYIFYYN